MVSLRGTCLILNILLFLVPRCITCFHMQCDAFFQTEKIYFYTLYNLYNFTFVKKLNRKDKNVNKKKLIILINYNIDIAFNHKIKYFNFLTNNYEKCAN